MLCVCGLQLSDSAAAKREEELLRKLEEAEKANQVRSSLCKARVVQVVGGCG